MSVLGLTEAVSTAWCLLRSVAACLWEKGLCEQEEGGVPAVDLETRAVSARRRGSRARSALEMTRSAERGLVHAGASEEGVGGASCENQ